MYYGHYDQKGKYIGFYIRELHGDNIPAPNIELTPEQHQEALTGNYRVVDGQHTYSPPPGPTAEELRTTRLIRLNAEYAAEKTVLRDAYVTAVMRQDTELEAEIVAEQATLDDGYAAKLGLINAGQDPWEVA